MIRQLSALLIFFSLLLSAQNKAGVQLKRDWKTSKIFKGSIAGKPITLNLEYATHSGWNDKVFSVQGYYYYDTFKQKIPLAGFYNGNLLLYNFGALHSQLSKQLLAEELFCYTLPCPLYEPFKELFKISQSNKNYQNGKLQVNGKKYAVSIKDSSLDLTPRDEWLLLPNGKKYNLRNLIDEFGGNVVIASYEDSRENRVLLQFERDSNFNKQGFCGASPPDKGFRLLTFDKNWKFKAVSSYVLSGCREDAVFMGEKKTKHIGIKAYYVAQHEVLNLLVVNLRNSSIIFKKLVSPYDPYAEPFKGLNIN